MAPEPKYSGSCFLCLPSQRWTVECTDLGLVYSVLVQCWIVQCCEKLCVTFFQPPLLIIFISNLRKLVQELDWKTSFEEAVKKTSLNGGWPFSLVSCKWTYSPCLTWATFAVPGSDVGELLSNLAIPLSLAVMHWPLHCFGKLIFAEIGLGWLIPPPVSHKNRIFLKRQETKAVVW